MIFYIFSVNKSIVETAYDIGYVKHMNISINATDGWKINYVNSTVMYL